MIAALPFLVAAGITAGPVLANVSSAPIRRLLGWSVVIVGVVAANQVLFDSPSLLWMVGICCVLLGGMKGLLYAEWAIREKLPLTRYLIFSLLWFGMEPGCFKTRRTNLSWKQDVGWGTLWMVIGISASLVVAWMGWHNLWAMFFSMSLAFHYGGLRLLNGCLRAAGFPVRTLFPNLFHTRGIGDFWSTQWNVGYSHMMQRIVGRPVAALVGRPAGMIAIFLSSGLLHELAITLPVKSGYGGPTAYFAFHGWLAWLEKKRGRPFGKIPALLAVVVPLGCLFPATFRNEVMTPCVEWFGAHVSHFSAK